MLKVQKGVLYALLKQIGGNIIRGKSALKVSLPVEIFDKKTFLQRIAKTFAYSPSILQKAANEQDQLIAFKYSLAFIISILNLSIDQRKPFNPIIGETYQGYIDNYPIFLEQISHHPPISSFLYMHNDFSLYGNWEQYAQLNFNSVLAQYIGIAVIAFQNREILFTLPQCSVYNISIGKRYVTFDKECYIYDRKNMFLCQLFFNSSENKSKKPLNPHQKQVDYFSGKIFKMKSEVELSDDFKMQKNSYSEVLSDVLGVWHEFLQIDNQIYWRQDMYPACDILNHENPLPSDSTLRPDLIQFQNNNLVQAQNEKVQIEENQRQDVAQRRQYKKK